MGDQGAPVAPEQPVVLPAPVLPGWSLVPPPPSPPRHRRLLVPGIAVAVLLIVAALVMLWPATGAGGDEPGGEAIIGTGLRPTERRPDPGTRLDRRPGAASATSVRARRGPGWDGDGHAPGSVTTVPGRGTGR
jgi:hypothetical protein